jgi:hypothetical protein
MEANRLNYERQDWGDRLNLVSQDQGREHPLESVAMPEEDESGEGPSLLDILKYYGPAIPVAYGTTLLLSGEPELQRYGAVSVGAGVAGWAAFTDLGVAIDRFEGFVMEGVEGIRERFCGEG